MRKVEARIAIWVNRILSRGGRLVLIKEVLEGILIYWNSIVAIHKGILELRASKTWTMIPSPIDYTIL
jgi:hypothetical protein